MDKFDVTYAVTHNGPHARMTQVLTMRVSAENAWAACFKAGHAVALSENVQFENVTIVE